MPAFRDLTGHRVGFLTVIDRAADTYNNRGLPVVMWRCKCECGNETVLRGGKVTSGRYVSCGCYNREQIQKTLGRRRLQGPKLTSVQVLLGRYRTSARVRELPFELTEDQFKAITSCNCSYCGAPPAQRVQQSTLAPAYTYNGVDRIDSSRGYVFGNCVACCTMCNRMKMDYPAIDFVAHCGRVVANQFARWFGDKPAILPRIFTAHAANGPSEVSEGDLEDIRVATGMTDFTADDVLGWMSGQGITGRVQ
jgi:hypothetical protein